ncbi:hypothetical protein PCE1_003165 [Barthelona sp. PCE]
MVNTRQYIKGLKIINKINARFVTEEFKKQKVIGCGFPLQTMNTIYPFIHGSANLVALRYHSGYIMLFFSSLKPVVDLVSIVQKSPTLHAVYGVIPLSEGVIEFSHNSRIVFGEPVQEMMSVIDEYIETPITTRVVKKCASYSRPIPTPQIVKFPQTIEEGDITNSLQQQLFSQKRRVVMKSTTQMLTVSACLCLFAAISILVSFNPYSRSNIEVFVTFVILLCLFALTVLFALSIKLNNLGKAITVITTIGLLVVVFLSVTPPEVIVVCLSLLLFLAIYNDFYPIFCLGFSVAVSILTTRFDILQLNNSIASVILGAIVGITFFYIIYRKRVLAAAFINSTDDKELSLSNLLQSRKRLFQVIKETPLRPILYFGQNGIPNPTNCPEWRCLSMDVTVFGVSVDELDLDHYRRMLNNNFSQDISHEAFFVEIDQERSFLWFIFSNNRNAAAAPLINLDFDSNDEGSDLEMLLSSIASNSITNRQNSDSILLQFIDRLFTSDNTLEGHPISVVCATGNVLLNILHLNERIPVSFFLSGELYTSLKELLVRHDQTIWLSDEFWEAALVTMHSEWEPMQLVEQLAHTDSEMVAFKRLNT